MKLRINFGEERTEIELAKKNILGVADPLFPAHRDEAEVLHRALKHPIDSQSLDDFIGGTDNILIVVNDASRPTPTPLVIRKIYDLIKNKNCRFIVATGAHAAPTVDELSLIFGSHYASFKDRIIIHDASEKSDLVDLGRSRNGTALLLNRAARAAGRIVSISSIEPHYFAGYTGGRKSFLPGIAGYPTIRDNHRWALDPRARVGALTSNPIHEDMLDLVDRIDPRKIFTIQLISDRRQRISHAFCGHIYNAYTSAIAVAQRIYSIPLKEKADIVIAVARPPFDKNLYQSLKAIEHGRVCLKRGGILILVSPCAGGLGPGNFSRLFQHPDSMAKAVDHAMKAYDLGDHNAVRLYQLSRWGELWTVTRIADKVIERGRLTPFPSIQAALEMALKKIGARAKILFLMDAPLTIPVFGPGDIDF
jgi:nickel-dependent lactate racemase